MADKHEPLRIENDSESTSDLPSQTWVELLREKAVEANGIEFPEPERHEFRSMKLIP